MFLNLLAASLDGLICGFALSGMGVKFSFKDILLAFGIIFMCCISASALGKYSLYMLPEKYIDIIAGCMMLYMAASAIFTRHKVSEHSNILHGSLSVAIDASSVCIYLGIFGYNIVVLSVISAFLHCVLMAAANITANTILKPDYLKNTRYISCCIFLIMGISRLI